jgi:hypothetical protein
MAIKPDVSREKEAGRVTAKLEDHGCFWSAERMSEHSTT